MTPFLQKKKLHHTAARVLFCTAGYILLALFVLVLFLFSGSYCEIYDSPRVRNGGVDFRDVNLPSRDVACNLAGDWEFFYNQWIVTDGCEGEADGLIKLPGVWTYRSFGKGALPRSGYASYRLRADNVQAGITVTVYRHYCNCAFRVFINGELNFRSGELSKETDETVITGRTAEKRPYLTNGSPLEIVIEVSASDTGGFHAAPWIAATATGNSYGSELRAYNYIALGIAIAAVAVSILSFFFFRFKRDITVPAFMLALFAHFLSSRDMLYLIRWELPAAMICGLLSAIASFVLLVLHLKRSGATLRKIPVIASAAAATVFTALTFAFYGTPLAPVFAFALFAVGCGYLVPIAFNREFAPVQRYVYGALFVFLMSVFCFELCDWLDLLVFGTEFIFTVELLLIIACSAAMWLWKLAKNARNAIRVSELECELSTLKNQALLAQIEPHFIFNSLTAIQSRYRDGLGEGDRAIEQFARHLRLIADSKGEDMIGFDDELRNVLNYFELENLRAGGKLKLLLDTEYTDFSVPVLSLQPLVENAVKHANLSDTEDGYILLSSEWNDGTVTVRIEDNGSGFDPEKTQTGVGLENARKRFALMGADMEIESAPDRGTKIIITVPLE